MFRKAAFSSSQVSYLLLYDIIEVVFLEKDASFYSFVRSEIQLRTKVSPLYIYRSTKLLLEEKIIFVFQNDVIIVAGPHVTEWVSYSKKRHHNATLCL